MMGRQRICHSQVKLAVVSVLLCIAILFSWVVSFWPPVQVSWPQSELLSDISLITKHSFTTTECITGDVIQKWSGIYNVKLGIETPKNFSMETDEERNRLFQKIFDQKIWLKKNSPQEKGYEDVQSSGSFSTIKQSALARRILGAVIDKVKKDLNKEVIQLLDIPCGDMVWMNRFLKSRSDIEYVGMDIVPDLIEKHKHRYGNMTNWSFRVHDIVKSKIDGKFDLIFSRYMTMVLQTLETVQVLNHFSSAGSFLLLSDYPTTRRNFEIDMTKRHRWIDRNLSLYPFKLTPALCISAEVVHTWLALHKLPLHQFHECNETKYKYLTHTLSTCAK